MRSLAPYTHLHLDAEILRRWPQFDRRVTVLHNTDMLFLHALRPYWEHYLGRATRIGLDGPEVLESADLFTRDLLRRGLEKGQTVFAGASEFDRLGALRDADSVALLASDSTIDSLRARTADFGTRSSCEVVLPARVARLEVEPAWRRIKAELHASPPQLVLVQLGWEQVVYAARLCESLGCSVISFGAAATNAVTPRRPLLRRLLR